MSGNNVWPQIFKKSPKFTLFGLFNEPLSTQNINVARFSHNVEWYFFCDFQTPCVGVVVSAMCLKRQDTYVDSYLINMVRACCNFMTSWIMYFSSVIFYYFLQSDFARNSSHRSHRSLTTASGPLLRFSGRTLIYLVGQVECSITRLLDSIVSIFSLLGSTQARVRYSWVLVE